MVYSGEFIVVVIAITRAADMQKKIQIHIWYHIILYNPLEFHAKNFGIPKRFFSRFFWNPYLIAMDSPCFFFLVTPKKSVFFLFCNPDRIPRETPKVKQFFRIPTETQICIKKWANQNSYIYPFFAKKEDILVRIWALHLRNFSLLYPRVFV